MPSPFVLEPAVDEDKDIFDRLTNPKHFPATTHRHLRTKAQDVLKAEAKSQAAARPPKKEYSRPVYGEKQPAIFDRLTDSRYYTGSHKHRFDSNGLGRGLDGRTTDETMGDLMAGNGRIVRDREPEVRVTTLPPPPKKKHKTKNKKTKKTKKKNNERDDAVHPISVLPSRASYESYSTSYEFYST